MSISGHCRVKLGPVGALHAMNRPRAALGLERGVVGRMPVSGGEDQADALGERLHRPGDLVAARNLERTTGREVVLEVDDQKRLGHGLNFLPGLGQTMLLRPALWASGVASGPRGRRSPLPAAGRRRRATPRSRGFGHGVHAAEEQVPLRPAGDGVPPRLEPRQGLGSMPGSACTAPASKWSRGASTASAASIPSATRRTIVCRTADRIRFEPPLPSPSSSLPSRSSTVGDIIEGTRRPGGRVWKPNGLRSSSPSMLLTWTPVPGTIRPEPVPFEQVTLAQRPSASTAVIWVVEPRPSPGPTSAGGRAKASGRARRPRRAAPGRGTARASRPRKGRREIPRCGRPAPPPSPRRPARPRRRRADRAGRGRRRSGCLPRRVEGW